VPLSLDVAVTPSLIATCAPATIAVVIDVLRATTTIVTALENGATGIVPVRETDEAIAVMRRIGRERVLLGGERGAETIAGFDLGNSPAAYAADVVAGKTLAFTTTNGTRALVEAARSVPVVLCGALINRDAVARALLAAGGAALLVCAGDGGALSFEDLLAAGAIVAAVHGRDAAVRRSDAARVAMTLYESNKVRITTAVASGAHARRLRELGFANDIAACARVDSSEVVPVYRDAMIVRHTPA
jgi:2-phosphosulfolactate phosphatase